MKHPFVWLFLFCGFILGGCSSSKRIATPVRHVERISHAVPVSEDQTGRLVREARKWIGTPYRYGGQTRSGTDCSGMVMVLFGEVYGLQLPRASAQQRDFALPVSEQELSPGDLVFFATSGSSAVSHVGIYIGSGKMIHASTSRGVIESSLNEKYYRQHFHSAGRIVAPASGAASAESRKQLKKTIKELEKEKKRLLRLEQQIESQIDTTSTPVYVPDPEIFD